MHSFITGFKRVTGCWLAVAGCFFLPSAWSTAWSMDCTRASTSVEKLICSDPVLKALDDALNTNYVRMLYSNIGDGARSYLRKSQREWLRLRGQCQSRECLQDLYVVRVDEVCEFPVISGVHAYCETAQSVLDSTQPVMEGSRHEAVRR